MIFHLSTGYGDDYGRVAIIEGDKTKEEVLELLRQYLALTKAHNIRRDKAWCEYVALNPYPTHPDRNDFHVHEGGEFPWVDEDKYWGKVREHDTQMSKWHQTYNPIREKWNEQNPYPSTDEFFTLHGFKVINPVEVNVDLYDDVYPNQ